MLGGAGKSHRSERTRGERKLNWKIELRLYTLNLTGKWRFCRTHDFEFNEAHTGVDIISFKTNIISTGAGKVAELICTPARWWIIAHDATPAREMNNLLLSCRPPSTRYKYDAIVIYAKNVIKMLMEEITFQHTFSGAFSAHKSTLHPSRARERCSPSHPPASARTFQRAFHGKHVFTPLSLHIPWPFFGVWRASSLSWVANFPKSCYR